MNLARDQLPPDRQLQLFSVRHLRLPDSHLHEIYAEAQKELITDSEGLKALPFKTYLGPFLFRDDLPVNHLHPAFRFYVEQDASGGGRAGQGR